MRKALFLILGLVMALKAWAQTPIEIYAKGDKYDSLQAYEASKDRASSGKIFSKPGAGNSQLNSLSDSARHKLYVLSVEKGVVGAWKDFYQIPVGRTISADQMEGAIKTAVTASGGPKLLISQSGKVSIMTMATDDTHK